MKEFAHLNVCFMAAGNSTLTNQTDARTDFVNGIVSGGTAPISINEHIGGGVVHKASSRCQDLLELLDWDQKC